MMQLHLTELAAQEEIRRANEMRQHWQYYYGNHPQPLKVRPGQPDDNVTANLCRMIVNTGVSALFGHEVTFELDEQQETKAEQWLAGCWDANRKMVLLQKLALNGAVTGHAFVKLVPARQGEPYPRLIVLDPATVTVRWAMDDIDDVRYYKIEWQAIDPQTGKAVGWRQLIERNAAGTAWTITDQRRNADGARWETVGTQFHPYPWAPVIDCQNLPAPNEYWGVSDLEADVIALQKSINFTMSNMSRILKFWAGPKTWGRGFNAQELDMSVDALTILKSEKGELHNLEMQSDLSSSLDYLAKLKEVLHQIARVPEVAAGKVEDIGQLSGAALAILFRPLLEMTETKRLTYGYLLIELNRRLLDLGGFGAENRTALHWPELLPKDSLQERQTAVLDKELGVSKDTLLQKLGYDPDVEREKRQADAAEAQAMADTMLTVFERGQDTGQQQGRNGGNGRA